MATDDFGIENYTIEEIQRAFRRHSHRDNWGVPAMYETSLLAALRGEFDTEEG